eukprot:4075152-Alexandrium_andersonii.AAC.1
MWSKLRGVPPTPIEFVMFIDEGGAVWAAADPTVGRRRALAHAGGGPGRPLGRMRLIEAIPGAVNGAAPAR